MRHGLPYEPLQRLLVIGANGQIGSALCALAADRFDLVPFTREDMDITDHARTRRRLLELAPQIVVNTAAFHRVDACEDAVDEAFRVNAGAVLPLARACEELGALLVHLSTDFVFGSDVGRTTPYSEEDTPGPLNVYGVSKLAGESFVRAYCRRHLIVRTSSVFGPRPGAQGPHNFIEAMIERAKRGDAIKMVDDQRSSATFAPDLAEAILGMCDAGALGIVHVTNQGECTRYEVATEVFRLLGAGADLSSTTSTGFNARATRPTYSVLHNERYRLLGFQPLRPWREALAAYIRRREDTIVS